MQKIVLVILFGIVSIQLCGKPVGLANCGNTCFENAAIQMAYQIDPLIDILSTQQDLYMQNTLGYTFQHLVWDIIKAQENNKSFIECGSADNPTNLKKLTEGIYSCMKARPGEMGYLKITFRNFLQELQKTSYNQLTSILTVLRERTYKIIYDSGPESQIIVFPPGIPSFDLVASADFEDNIRALFEQGLDTFEDPQTGISTTSEVFFRLLSVPKFIVFNHEFTLDRPYSIRNYFPDTLDLSKYIKGHWQALYQLRAIGVYTPGHYFAVIRDRDGKLYVCNDRSVWQVNTWQEGIGSDHPVLFLYLLKTTTNIAETLIDKLITFRQSLKNLERLLISI